MIPFKILGKDPSYKRKKIFMKYEYRTTKGTRDYRSGYETYECEDPKPPYGNNWEMIGSAMSGIDFFWFWRREVK